METGCGKQSYWLLGGMQSKHALEMCRVRVICRILVFTLCQEVTSLKVQFHAFEIFVRILIGLIPSVIVRFDSIPLKKALIVQDSYRDRVHVQLL